MNRFLISSLLIGLAVAGCLHPQTSFKPDGWAYGPFSPTREVRIAVPPSNPTHVTATIYDIMGENLGIIFDGIVDSIEVIELDRIVDISRHDRKVDTLIRYWDSLQPGLYFCKFVTPDTTGYATLINWNRNKSLSKPQYRIDEVSDEPSVSPGSRPPFETSLEIDSCGRVGVSLFDSYGTRLGSFIDTLLCRGRFRLNPSVLQQVRDSASETRTDSGWLPVDDLPSGIYFLETIVSGDSRFRKVAFLK